MEKKRKTRNLILTILLLAIAAGMAALPAILRSRKKEPDDKASYLNARVERKTILSTISGGGTLEQEKGVAVKVHKGVEISEYLVSNGDWVEKGQPLALVDPISVRKTIATVQPESAPEIGITTLLDRAVQSYRRTVVVGALDR